MGTKKWKWQRKILLTRQISIKNMKQRAKNLNFFTGPNKENLRIKFPSYKSTGVKFTEERNAQGHKCFRMSGGKVEVCCFLCYSFFLFFFFLFFWRFFLSFSYFINTTKRRKNGKIKTVKADYLQQLVRHFFFVL